MRRCIFVLMIASVAALGQEQPAVAPKADVPLTLRVLKDALRGSDFIKGPRGERPDSKVCAVALLVVPVDPNIDPKISISKKPAANIDHMPIARGVPPCAPRNEERRVTEEPPSP